MKPLLSLASLALACAAPAAAADTALNSPDGRITLGFRLADLDGAAGCPVFDVSFRGKPVIGPSRLGFDGQEELALAAGFTIAKTSTRSHDSTWKPVYGERSEIRDRYNELTVELTRDGAFPLTLVLRCYDEGAAIRTTIGGEGKLAVPRELTDFRFPGDPVTWTTNTPQGLYRKTTLAKADGVIEAPMTLAPAEDLFVAIAEAGLIDSAPMKLARAKDDPHRVGITLKGPVEATLPFATPWRVIRIAESPGKLLEGNDIILNLSEPCRIADTSWIRPGKVLREVTLTTSGAIAAVDCAVKNQLQFIEFDAGWYGHEYDDASDATTVTVDPKRSKGPLDLHQVIRYASQHGVGVILYVNRRALERQLDEILPLYQKWGVKGVKYGFVQVGTQQWTRWLHEAVRKAADHKLMVDVHDDYRPLGFSRTYPNFMTQEGICGDETSPTNETSLTILFTRMLGGAGDNTVCYYDQRVDKNATHAYQLAKAVCFYSPWQFLFWYDRPAASAGGKTANVIGDEPELAFWAAMPTVWDETRVSHARIGEYAVIARRSGAEWFVGAMNAGAARSLDLPLDFLPAGTAHTAHTYSDDDNVKTRTRVGVGKVAVDATTVLRLDLKPNGGQAIWIVPATNP